MKIRIIDQAVAILNRRYLSFLVPFLVLFISSAAVVLVLPKTYLSTGKIGVESQQIPEEFVRSTITTHAGERVGMMQARVMTTSRLVDIVERLQLYTEDWVSEPKNRLAGRLEDNIVIDVIRDPYASRLGAIAFTVGFEHRDPETARTVAAELVKLFLDENVSTRTARAAETTEFLGREEEKLGEQARLVDQQIAEFKRANRDALPEHLELKVKMVSRAESDLRAVVTEMSSLQQERRFLETQSSADRTRADPDVAQSDLSPAEQLESMKVELAEKSLRYSPEHWDIRALEAKIVALEAQLSGDGVTQKVAASTGTRAASQYRSIVSRMNLLRDQEKTLRSDLERLQAEILEIPLVEIELRRLTDLYNVYMEEFSEIRSKRHDASLAQSLEQEEQAERFILLEPPEIPLEPTRSLFQLMVMSLLFSMGGGAAVVYIAELLDDRIYGRDMLESLTGQQPLAVIPFLDGVKRLGTENADSGQPLDSGGQAA